MIEQPEMKKKGSSLSDLRQAGATRGILRAQVATNEALGEVKNTTRILLERIGEARARGLPRHSFAANRAIPRLPRANPFGM
jgi:hypothetical protein